MRTKIFVTGAEGQLGNELRELLQSNRDFHVKYTDVAELDITNEAEINNTLNKFKPTILINCSAYTNVDKAEEEKEVALQVNELGPTLLAKGCKKHEVLFIHISTDYVFSGNGYRPYKEADHVDSVNFYGETKLRGEKAVMEVLSEAVIIRTSWLYSSFGGNFVKTMLRLGNERDHLGVVDDQVGTPTYAEDLARAVIAVVDNYASGVAFDKGIYHFSNEGVCTWYDFAKKIQEVAENECRIDPIESKDFPTPAARPFYSVLSKQKIKKQFGITIPHWEDSLRKCIAKLI